MTPDLEQLADEAIEVQHTDIERALNRHHMAIGKLADRGPIDHLDRSRAIIAATWASTRPALTQLANDRRAAIARLGQQGITPDDGCTVTVGRVTIEAVRDLHPVSHRYRVMRGREQAGWAWLSASAWCEGAYLVVATGLPSSLPIAGATLPDALERAARRLNAMPLTEASAS